ncbi:hypothetical protein [Streptomyces sp. NPDC056387]|uniref:hypothetical protein n=1 Tax=Streptomyces sp. NPDC056387 TaxID=3345803 RepID=UPI0035D7EB65
MTDDFADAAAATPDVPGEQGEPGLSGEPGASGATGDSRAAADSPAAGDPGAAGARGEAAPEPSAGPAGPEPLGLVRTPTGHAGVDAHLERLADADHLTADGHLVVYEDVHRGLRDALSALDAPPVPGPYENRS